jgi:hypothetical protein
MVVRLFMDIISAVEGICILSRQTDKRLLCYLTRLLEFHIFCSVMEKERYDK